MELNLVNELWSELRSYIGSSDREDAIECLINVLSENGYSVEEIKSAFKSDSEVRRLATEYFGAENDTESGDEEYEDDDFDRDY